MRFELVCVIGTGRESATERLRQLYSNAHVSIRPTQEDTLARTFCSRRQAARLEGFKAIFLQSPLH